MAIIKKTQSDPETLEAKINLRMNSLPDKKEISVLDAFAGEGIIWNAIQRRCPEKKFDILSIDKAKYSKLNLIGDNIKWLQSLDLFTFDLIDLDAYGSAIDQLEIIFDRQYKGIVHVTYIQMMTINEKILAANGYSPGMLQKVKTIFYSDATRKFLNYLANKGVREAEVITKGVKNYLWFKMT